MYPTLIVLQGLPASGKSTYAKELQEEKGFIVHSSDALRIELYGDVNTFDKNGELFNELHKRIKKDLKEGKNVVYDATNLNRKKRISFLKSLDGINCFKEIIVLATPYNMCVQFDKLREKKVGFQVIKNMYFSFQLPLYQEGWVNIHLKYYEDIDWESDDYDFYKQLELLDGFNQFNEHHKLTVGQHCRKVKEILQNKGAHISVMVAGMLHDISKPKTFSFLNSRGEFTNSGHFYSHELVSCYDSMFYVEKILMASYNHWSWHRDFSYNILALISEHMKPHLLKDEALEKYKEFVGKGFWDNLMLLHEADVEGKE